MKKKNRYMSQGWSHTTDGDDDDDDDDYDDDVDDVEDFDLVGLL